MGEDSKRIKFTFSGEPYTNLFNGEQFRGLLTQITQIDNHRYFPSESLNLLLDNQNSPARLMSEELAKGLTEWADLPNSPAKLVSEELAKGFKALETLPNSPARLLSEQLANFKPFLDMQNSPGRQLNQEISNILKDLGPIGEWWKPFNAVNALATLGESIKLSESVYSGISFPNIHIPSRSSELDSISYPSIPSTSRNLTWASVPFPLTRHKPETILERHELIASDVDPLVLRFISETLQREDVKNHPVLSAILSMSFDELVIWAMEKMKSSKAKPSVFVATFGATAPTPNAETSRDAQDVNPMEQVRFERVYFATRQGFTKLVEEFTHNWGSGEIDIPEWSVSWAFEQLHISLKPHGLIALDTIALDGDWEKQAANVKTILYIYPLYEKNLFKIAFLKDLTAHLDKWIGASASAPVQRESTEPSRPSQTRKVKPETRERAEIFRAIKDANKKLSYAGVAMQAIIRGYPDATEDDVRNDYRAMEWDWEPANKIR